MTKKYNRLGGSSYRSVKTAFPSENPGQTARDGELQSRRRHGVRTQIGKPGIQKNFAISEKEEKLQSS